MRSRVTTSVALTLMIGTLGVYGAGVAGAAEPVRASTPVAPATTVTHAPAAVSDGPLDRLFDTLFGNGAATAPATPADTTVPVQDVPTPGVPAAPGAPAVPAAPAV
ncbi:hypothetical protein GTW08_29955, partial [Pseudonocardia sp. SID8383]|nr:hypothetical protein [Pseudonocardia sp. SID8383]